MECPARAGRVRCPLVPATNDLPVTVPIVLNPPEQPAPVCTQATVTISREDLGKHHQVYPYGTTEHGRSYKRRTAVERGNAYMDRHYGNLRRGTIRCFGLNATCC